MDKTVDEAIELFRSQKIPVFEPGEEEYERSVATPNLLFRFSRPHLVIQPETASHVQAIIKQARAQKLKITIKCGGHSYAGHSTAYKGISLDLKKMNTVMLDIKSKTVTMDAGCKWGHVYKALVNGRHNGFIINGGRCPFVGVSGFILGGGLSPFTRSFGMGCDTLEEATIVTADGELVTVKDNNDPNSKEGKLFWALRGAGGGNFGVLVKMKLKVQQLQNKDGVVVAGRYQWFPNSGITNDFMTTMNNFYTTDWPNQMTIDSTWMCDLQQKEGDGVRFLIYYDGNKDEFDTLIDKYIKQPELAKQLKRRSLPEKSTRFLHETLVAQWSEETTKAFPTNKTYNIYSSFVFNNDKISIEKVTAIIREEMKTFRRLYRGEKVQFLVTWIHSGGKAREKKPSDTAFFWREAVYHTYVTVDWEDKWMERDMRGFLKKIKKKLRPFSLKRKAAFINFADGELSKKAYEKAYFGDNRKELRRIKKIWDKDNFFKWTQGIQLPQDIDDDGELDVDVPDKEDMTDTIAKEQWEYFKTDDFVKDLKEFVDNVDKFVKEHPILERFFKGKKNYIKELVQKAADLKNDPSTPLGSKDLLPKTIKVTLRQQVIYCDDSSSMKRDGRWDSQKRLVDRIAKITTRILPEGQGIALRFINQDVNNNSNLTLAEIRNILKPMSYKPGGNTEIGTYLRSKILEPLVYSKLESKSLERPLLISVITDGMPEGEKSSEFVDAILECGNKLEGAKYPRESVKFMVGQIGTGKAAAKFLKTIRNNTKIAKLVYCTSDQLDAKFEEFHKNEGDLDRWLVETLYLPIKDSEDKEDHESDGTGTKIDLNAVRTEIRDIINASEASEAASFIRLAFHTLASYNIFSKTIGLNTYNNRNGGLKEAIGRLEIVKQNHQWISYGDLWTLAGVIAVDVMGGPTIPWGPGRKDGIESEEHEHIPGISLDPNKVREELEPMGLNDRDIVAFMGAHTVGRCHEQTSEIEGKWTELNNLFTNQFYVNLRKLGKRLKGQILDSKKDFFPQDGHDMIMLSSDLALFLDPTFKKLVKTYAKNQQKFFTDFAEAFGKLLRRSLNQSDGSFRFELKAQYNIFFTEERLAPTLSTAQLIFSAQDPESLSFSVTGIGVDDKGSYEINGSFVPSLTTISFTRSYTGRNYLYRGQYNQELYFGKWGTSIQPNLGNFIIKRVAKVEKSLTGKWRGYYFYKINNESDRMEIELNFTHNEIKGSGSDSVGRFEIINGHISGDLIKFVKKYPQLSQNYQGQRKGSEIWGKWDTGTPDSGGVFLIWGLMRKI